MKNADFVLVEPFISNHLEDRPNLGCASLIAANEARGISTRLVHGQTSLIEELFLGNIDETWELVEKKRLEDLAKGTGSKAETFLHEREFKERLPELYRKIILDKNARNYLNRKLFAELEEFYLIAYDAYQYWIEKGKEDIRLIDNYVQKILESPTDIIGFSIYLKKTLPFSRLIRKKIKEKCPDVAIVIGGSFSPFLEEEEISELFAHEYCDFLIIGEADKSLPELIAALRTEKNYSDIKNLCFIENGALRRNERETISFLEELPFPTFSQFKLDRYPGPYLILPIQSSRGCSYKKCAFCAHYQVTQDKFTVLTSSQVAEKVRFYRQEYGCEHFAFHDDDMPPTIIKRICESLREKKIDKVYFYGYGRLVKKFRDSKLISLMRESGFRAIAWGLESASQQVLDKMKKGIDVQDAEHILREFHQAGILNLCFVMFGFPGEKQEDAMETMNFLQRNADFIASILPGTYKVSRFSPVWETPEKFGVTMLDRGKFSVSEGISPKEAVDFLKKMNFVISTRNMETPSAVSGNDFSRMQVFLIGSHEHYHKKSAIKSFLSGTADNLYPVIPGDVLENNGICEFQPIETSKSMMLHKLKPAKRMALLPWETRAILLADGSKNIGEIGEILLKEFFPNEKNGLRLARDFFQNMAKLDYAIFFGKSWGKEGAKKPSF